MTINQTIYQVDAFTNELFKGNPAGVMIVDDSCTTEWMQQIAAEMNLAETAFLISRVGFYEIRFFTPIQEIPLCGHATLASAHILYELGIKNRQEEIHFKAEGGDLTVSQEDKELKMIFPTYTFEKIDITSTFSDIMGFQPLEMYKSNSWTVAIAKTENEIENAYTNFETMKSNGLGQLIISSQSERNEIDFVLRCFAPIAGINEDPVTGSAQCAITPIWNHKTGKTTFNAQQISKRAGDLKTRLVNDKIEIYGKAVTVFKIELV